MKSYHNTKPFNYLSFTNSLDLDDCEFLKSNI